MRLGVPKAHRLEEALRLLTEGSIRREFGQGLGKVGSCVGLLASKAVVFHLGAMRKSASAHESPRSNT